MEPDNHNKILKYILSANEKVQFTFFLGLVVLASLVSYFQTLNLTQVQKTPKEHVIDYLKVFLSGMLAFSFTLFLAGEFNWSFYKVCIIGGVNVLFSKQFFDAIQKIVKKYVSGTKL